MTMEDTPHDLFFGSSTAFKNYPWRPLEVAKSALGTVRSATGKINVNLWPDFFDENVGLDTYRVLDVAAKTSEWAVFVFRGDDLVKPHGAKVESYLTVRDNVLFELGLFYGHLGHTHVFILEEAPKRKAARVASDISGITRLRFSDEATFRTQLERIGHTIQDRSKKPRFGWVPASSLALGYRNATLVPFVHKRRDRAPKDFAIKVFVPVGELRYVELSHVRSTFERHGYESIGADGTTTNRPLLWHRPGDDRTYYDIPTTLLTMDGVIDAVNLESERLRGNLTRSQVLAFKAGLERDGLSELDVSVFDSWNDLVKALD
jgi:hypothetical protein